MSRNNRDVFQRMGDKLFGGSRTIAIIAFVIGLVTVPVLALIAMAVFGRSSPEEERQKARQREEELRRSSAFSGQQKPRYTREGRPEPRNSASAPFGAEAPRQPQAQKPVPPPPPAHVRPQKTGDAQADALLEACYQFLCSADEYLPEMDDHEARACAKETCAKVQAIMDLVHGQPETAAHAGRLSSYYLPTTLKLLRTYTAVDNNPGRNAQEICRQVHKSLITLNQALENMQDDLLGNTAMDVEAEIAAMEQMLGSEGLTDELRMPGLDRDQL